jgi:hypothetical protein
MACLLRSRPCSASPGPLSVSSSCLKTRSRRRRRSARLAGGRRRCRFAHRLAHRSRFRRGLQCCLMRSGGNNRLSHIVTGHSTGWLDVTINDNASIICHRLGGCLIGHLLSEFGLFVHQVACFVKCFAHHSLHSARHERSSFLTKLPVIAQLLRSILTRATSTIQRDSRV